MTKFPRGVIAVFIIQIFSNTSFSILYASLVLYLTGAFNLSIKSANHITGIFIAVNFVLHFVSGYWGGRFISNRLLFCLAMVCQLSGCFLLATVDKNLLYYGLGAFLTGCGLNVTCVNCIINQHFQTENRQRESAFLWSYTGLNIGFLVGYSLSGYFQLGQNYSYLYFVSGIGNLIALLICIYFWPSLKDKNTAYLKLNQTLQRWSKLVSILVLASLPFLLKFLFDFAAWANQFILLLGISTFVFVYYLALKSSNEVRKKLLAFIVLTLVNVVFWMLYQMGPMGLTHFIANNVSSNWFSVTIPPQWYKLINPISVIIMSPLLIMVFSLRRSQDTITHIPSQFVLALVISGLGFIILPLGINNANSAGLISSGWVLVNLFLLSLGEILIYPIGYAMVGALIPASMQGIMMGTWMLAAGIGTTLSTYQSNFIAMQSETISPLQTNVSYSSTFFYLGGLAIFAALILTLLLPTLRRWIEPEQNKLANLTVSTSGL